jgi:hypothetical protein
VLFTRLLDDAMSHYEQNPSIAMGGMYHQQYSKLVACEMNSMSWSEDCKSYIAVILV